MTDQIWLLEVDYLDQTGALNTLRSTSAPAFMTRPNETPGNAAYAPSLLTPGISERHAWSRGTTRGPSTIGWGSPILDNSEGQYDFLKSCAVDGRQIRLRRGPAVQGVYPDDYPAYSTGTMEGAFFPWRQVQFLQRDSLGLFFQLPIQAALYGGTNALPAGFDGVATDWQGKCKPICLGSVSNASAPCVNTSKLTYQVHDRTNINVGAVTINAVYDEGVALIAGTQYATVALLQAAATTSGQWDWCDDPIHGTFFQLGASPAGAVTADASSAVNTVAGIINAIMTGPGGIDAALINGVGDLNNLVPGPVGKWIDTSQQYIGDVIKLFTDTCNAFLVDSRTGTWRMGKLALPTTAPTLRIKPYQIKDGQNGINVIQGSDLGSDAPKLSTNTPSLAVPVWRVVVNYDFNETVQTEADIAGAGLPRLGYTKQQYRQISVQDASVLNRHPLAVTLTIYSLFRNQADATGEGNAQLSLRKVAPTILEIPIDQTDAAAFDLMKAFGLDVERFDWPDLIFLDTGLVEDPGDVNTASKTTIVAWGVPDGTDKMTLATGQYQNPTWGEGQPAPDSPQPIGLEAGGDLQTETGQTIVTE
jgi:hypothetical protein